MAGVCETPWGVLSMRHLIKSSKWLLESMASSYTCRRIKVPGRGVAKEEGKPGALPLPWLPLELPSASLALRLLSGPAQSGSWMVCAI